MRTGIALFFFYKVSLMKHPNDDIKVEVTEPDEEKRPNYLVLGQEDYKEHRAPVTLISLSTVGGKIASCDSSGVIKV